MLSALSIQPGGVLLQYKIVETECFVDTMHLEVLDQEHGTIMFDIASQSRVLLRRIANHERRRLQLRNDGIIPVGEAIYT